MATPSKTAELIAAAKKRHEIEKQTTPPADVTTNNFQNWSEEETAAAKDAAEQMAEAKVQAKAGTIDGTIDIEAMGDVKGDGGDAKDYEDGDPAKALGVPTYVHGLHETKGGVETSVPPDNTVSAATAAEQEAGRAAMQRHSENSRSAREAAAREVAADKAAARTSTARTVVTETAQTPEEIAAEAKAKVAAKEAAEQKAADDAAAAKKAADAKK